MNVEVMLRKELQELMLNTEQIESVCKLFQKIENLRAEERKVKQMIGIAAARKQGKTLGRPRLKEPEGFKEVVRLWSQKRMNVHDAAQLCGMGVSTFYRRVNDLRSRAEREGGERNEAAKE